MKELENKIREALPRLKEVSVGLRFIDYTGFNAEIIYDYSETFYYFSESDNEVFCFRKEWFLEECIEIIGHPIKLNDVLEWCSSKTTDFFIENNKSYFAINYGDKNEKKFYWDLSSVFLADQSDELKEFLNSL